MSRPIGPKKQAALEQLEKLRAQGLPDDEIRLTLIEAGLTKAQALELLPTPAKEADKPKVMGDEAKTANIEGAIHFLNTIAQRLTPDACSRFPELVAVKSDALTWGRKLRGVL